jgi:uncharacterized protein with NRDE domain
MCLVAIAIGEHPRFPLLIAANRDEFHARPSRAAEEWRDRPGVYGGRDLEAGGGWFAADAQGRFALVTNIRRLPLRDGLSRGALVAEFLSAQEPASSWADAMTAHASNYRPFNLLLGDAGGVTFLNSESARPLRLDHGVHGVSNADLDTPWPKVRRLREVMRAFCARAGDDFSTLWHALADPALAPDDELPDTGIGLDRERFLSSAFITGETYGTRASTLLTVDVDGRVRLVESGFGPGGVGLGKTVLEWPGRGQM